MMAPGCLLLCLRCRNLLGSRISTQHLSLLVQSCAAPLPSGNPTGTRRIQMCYYSSAKHLEVLTSATDFVSNKSCVLQGPKQAIDLDDNVELSALEEIDDEEAVRISVPTALPPSSTSLKDYVDKSETLSKLVQLGVNLWKLEQRPNVGSMLLRLDYETDVATKLLFLKDIGVEDSCLGYIISRNPFILTQSLENLNTRVNYLKSKKFSQDTVASMVSRAPYLLSFSVKRLDNRMAFYQQQLNLSVANTRNVVSRLPRLLCGSLEPVKENLKVCEIELGFKKNEIQHIVLAVPKVLTANKKKLIQIFDFLHNTMKVPHHLIVKFPQVLNTKYLRVKERHLFLEYLEKAQYDPTQPNYIALDSLISLPDETFCSELASAKLEDFCLFQKTL
ncbi:transcription termination factor 3, mitochondrial [Periophthalmus magnuspinnatus]|uniref:transcription termination factor 3, mitochondrial n=1 Tax=Periophthalmus magnuspinnatus TaxID=409849 RepID=UPI00145BE2F6|nr:transcription termination factor 3, mitochondrial [Periophthalmus magnuspinnatus]XP_055081267.1 transcription termination factor 3, mitochondrial [Periophthalmus magnuspinnatus]